MNRLRNVPRLALLIAAAVIAAPAALAATGDPLGIGVRNPSGGTSAQNETQIIANTARGSYGTRQSNKGAGGGAIYGCRATLDPQAPANPDRSTPCIRVNNLVGGKAFDFVFDEGPVGGIIQSGNNLLTVNPQAAPFVTNATGIALGLNADRVDGKHADQLLAEARQAAETLVRQAAQGSGGAIGGSCPDGFLAVAGDCLERERRAAATFQAASSACAADGRKLPTVSVLLAARGEDGIDLGDGEMASDVTTGSVLSLPAPLDDVVLPDTYATVEDGGDVGSAELGSSTAFRCIAG